MKKVDIGELKKLDYEEGVKLLESLGYYKSDVSEDGECPKADVLESTYFTLLDENDNEIDKITYENFYNILEKHEYDMDDTETVLERWIRD